MDFKDKFGENGVFNNNLYVYYVCIFENARWGERLFYRVGDYQV